MKLIIGGAFQGKLEYATTQYGLADGWIDGADCVLEAIEDAAASFILKPGSAAFCRSVQRKGRRGS